MLSIKEKIFKNEILGYPDPSKGIQSILNPFYKQSTNIRHLPYKSIKSIINSYIWPSKFAVGFSETLAYDPDTTRELVGLTNDGINRFIIHSTFIEARLIQKHDNQKLHTINIDSVMSFVGYNHFGDGTPYFHPDLGGLIFLPIGGSQVIDEQQGNSIIEEVSLPGYISLFRVKDGTLDYLSGALLKTVDTSGAPETKGEVEWCALNPLNGLLYTAELHPVGFGPLQVYKPILELNQHSGLTGFSLDYVGQFPLFDEKGRSVYQGVMKGGVFSSTGHLYITLESVDKTRAVVGFDMISGRKVVHIPLHHLNLKGIDISPGNLSYASKTLSVCGTSPDDKHSHIQHIGVSDDDFDKI